MRIRHGTFFQRGFLLFNILRHYVPIFYELFGTEFCLERSPVWNGDDSKSPKSFVRYIYGFNREAATKLIGTVPLFFARIVMLISISDP